MTESGHVWMQIVELLGSARKSVILVAPFIKKAVFEAAVREIPPSVHSILCVTRWTPAEVAAGVSDPEILSIADSDCRIRVKLCPPLHAKIYVADDRCLTGSANLTGKATGRAGSHTNVELLVEARIEHPEIRRVLEQLEALAIDATRQMADLVRGQADLLRNALIETSTGAGGWYPVTRRPEKMYLYYSGRATFGPAVDEGVVRDLALLDVSVGLSEEYFNAEIQARLRALPELSALKNGGKLGNLELRRELIDQRGLTEDQARRATETIAAWLRHFDNYYMEIGSWELRYGREISP